MKVRTIAIVAAMLHSAGATIEATQLEARAAAIREQAAAAANTTAR